MKILLIGAGAIAHDYVKALHALGHKDISVLSRSEASAAKLMRQYALPAAFGGGEERLKTLPAFDGYIVAAPVESLSAYAELLAAAPRVLLEKPAFLSSGALKNFLAAHPHAQAAVAMNRLYFPSVDLLREKLAGEPVTSAEFSFTEWVHRIDTGAYAPEVLARWGIANCIHVIATVFDLIGQPQELHATQQGRDALGWHPAGSIFSGSGVTRRGVPFAYMSDWQSAGRWSITLRTAKGAYQLCPMEGLEFTPRGSVAREALMAPWQAETKCGFLPMLSGWLDGGRVVTLHALVAHLETVERIFGYADTHA